MNLYFLFLLSSAHILYLSHATILVKFGMVSTHYVYLMQKGFAEPDPLENFELHSRQMLCDAIIKAKQFMGKYHPAYHKRYKKQKTSLTSVQNDNVTGGTVNYQRMVPSLQDSDLSLLNYQFRRLRIGNIFHKRVKMLQCVNTQSIKWFITFGGVDKYLFLLEPDRKSRLRITGIFEPSAIIENRDFEYFFNQLQTSAEQMTSICQLGMNNRLLVCSAVLDVLSTEGSLDKDITQMNYLRPDQRCITSAVNLGGENYTPKTRLLPCTLFHQGSLFSPFHMLMDSLERGAVFVFFMKPNGRMELHARVTKIGALLNPVVSGKKTSHAEKADQEFVDQLVTMKKIPQKKRSPRFERVADHFVTMKKKTKKKCSKRFRRKMKLSANSSYDVSETEHRDEIHSRSVEKHHPEIPKEYSDLLDVIGKEYEEASRNVIKFNQKMIEIGGENYSGEAFLEKNEKPELERIMTPTDESDQEYSEYTTKFDLMLELRKPTYLKNVTESRSKELTKRKRSSRKRKYANDTIDGSEEGLRRQKMYELETTTPDMEITNKPESEGNSEKERCSEKIMSQNLMKKRRQKLRKLEHLYSTQN